MEPLHELELAYQAARHDPGFDAELRRLLRDYVGRPTPLSLAARLSERLGCRVYLKREDLCHTGAHKINNALGQALLVKRMGKTRVVAETGAGQHGVATATVCALLGLECVVYMGTDDMARQAPNVARMRLLGATVRGVDSGTRTLKDAINEAMRDWVANVRTHALPARLGARLPSLPGHGARLPGADRAGGPRADAGGDGRPAGPPRRLRGRRLERDRALLRLPRGRGRAHGRGRGRRPLVAAGRPCGALPARPLRQEPRKRGRGRRPPGHADVPAAGRGRQRAADALRLGRSRLPGRRPGARAPPRRGPRRVRLGAGRRGARRLPSARRDRGHPARARVLARRGLARARGGIAARADRAREPERQRRQGPGNRPGAGGCCANGSCDVRHSREGGR